MFVFEQSNVQEINKATPEAWFRRAYNDADVLFPESVTAAWSPALRKRVSLHRRHGQHRIDSTNSFILFFGLVIANLAYSEFEVTLLNSIQEYLKEMVTGFIHLITTLRFVDLSNI